MGQKKLTVDEAVVELRAASDRHNRRMDRAREKTRPVPTAICDPSYEKRNRERAAAILACRDIPGLVKEAGILGCGCCSGDPEVVMAVLRTLCLEAGR